ncbi:protein TolA, partial [Comamonas sp. CAH-2]|nr:protein TolA [Comamonas sp. CAH-2]
MSPRLAQDPFAPPRPSKRLRSWVLALLAHATPLVALVWNITPPVAVEQAAVEAELWSDTFVQAAPRAAAVVPPPAPAPTPAPAPEP